MLWFKNRVGDDNQQHGDNWKARLPDEWRGSNVSQRCFLGMNYSTIIQVPNTKDGTLYYNLVKEENRLAKLSG